MTKPIGAHDPPPYLRIAAELRRRVTAGELAPGDRVPSTRQLAREWGVAMATATKALTTLRLEGLVVARPRAGTVVAGGVASPAPPARRRPAPAPGPPPEAELSLDRIVRTAIDMADTEGLAALSMRGVAARLGVAVMSPYRYVPSKDELILLMADAAYGEVGYPAKPPAGWRPRVELGAHTLWGLYRRHPWLAQLGSLTRPLMVPNLVGHGEWLLRALDGHGLDPTTLFEIHLLVYSHVQGMAVHLEWETSAEADTGQSDEEWMDSRAPALRDLVRSHRFPTFTRVVGSFTDGYDLRIDDLFATGLRALLDGLTPLVEGHGARPVPTDGP
ncbi:GntR family transcriptional regulator [Streptomyces sp. NPDC057702]|uniref:GntR family transcriptional regulator n=1 Tax=unclassified Streptomyces TaxID=2593676 RepID=UPI0036C3C88E